MGRSTYNNGIERDSQVSMTSSCKVLTFLSELCSHPAPPRPLQWRVKTWEESKGEVDGIEATTADFQRNLEIVICREAAKAFPVCPCPDEPS